MSATMQTTLYRKYFSINTGSSITVDDRPFSVNIQYVEDFLPSDKKSDTKTLPVKLICIIRNIISLTANAKENNKVIVPDNLLNDQIALAMYIIQYVVRKGSGVMIFVSSVDDISDLTVKLNKLEKNN